MFRSRFFFYPKMNEKGQGLIEYLLVLIVVVSIALGVLRQFNQAFASFVDNYFGQYLSCLLETGELPGLGGQGEEGICAEEFEPFTFTAGRPPSQRGAGGGGRNISSGDRNGQGGDGSGASSDDGASAGSSRGSGGSGRGVGRGRISKGFDPSRSGGSTVSAGDIDSGKLNENQARAFRNPSGRTSQQNQRKRSKINAFTGELYKEQQENQRALAQKSVSAKRDGELRAKKVPFNIRKVAQSRAESEDEPWSLGRLIRFLLIILIIIAIVVFLGGQVLQVSKDWE